MTIKPRWLIAAHDDLGIHEIRGPKHNARVLQMFKTVGHPEIKDDETAWCAAALGCWLTQAGIKPPKDDSGKGTLWALDYASFGLKLTKPALGAIGVKARKNADGKVIGGHVFLIVGFDSKTKTVYGLGANQGDAVSLAEFDLAALKAIRWPGADMPEAILYDLPTSIDGAKRGLSEA